MSQTVLKWPANSAVLLTHRLPGVMMPKLTKRNIDALQPRRADEIIWDSEMPGFGVRIKSGIRTFVVQYRNTYGVSRRMTVGRYGRLTPEEARKLARQVLAAADRGDDPAGARKAARQACTVNQLCDEYLRAAEGRIKNSTLRMDRSRIDCHVRPILGTRIVPSLTPKDIERFQETIAKGHSRKEARAGRGGIAKGGKGAASRTVAMLGTILQRAVRDELIGQNPARGVQRYRDNARKPPFSMERVSALGRALREADQSGVNPKATLAIRLLLTTGCRRSEILGLRWQEIDSAARCFRFRDTKSGPQLRPVGDKPLALINALREQSISEFVLPSQSSDGHFVGLPKIWRPIAEQADLDGMTIHGLRHWFASAATELNFSELIIAGLLGHSLRSVTSRYATAPDSMLVAAANAVSDALIVRLEESNVVSFPRLDLARVSE